MANTRIIPGNWNKGRGVSGEALSEAELSI